MGFRIVVQPSGHAFEAEAGETILDAALHHGVVLPYGCRDGGCGTCRGRIVSGDVDHGRAQAEVLTVADRDAGKALFCCAKPHTDLVIESREVRTAGEVVPKTLPARVQKLTRAAPDVMIVDLKLPPNVRLQFLAGQYIDILLPGGRRRAFSLANPPENDDCLQLHVRHVPGGLFTDRVFATMKERDVVRIRGPHGVFYLREEPTKPMLLVAGGTGFAPIKAIVEHALAEDCGRPMSIYWGGRTQVDLYQLDVAEAWQNRNAQVRFVPVLSDAEGDTTWVGRRGLVHEAAMHDYPDLSGFQAYVCGSPAMVNAARRDFVAQCHLPEEEFFADSFVFANDAPADSSGAENNLSD